MSKLIQGKTPIFMTAVLLLNVGLPVASAASQSTNFRHNVPEVVASNHPQNPVLNWLVKQQAKKKSGLLDLFRRRRRDGGTRSGRFCPIAPGRGFRLTWSTRPTFVWQGKVKTLNLQGVGGKKVWSASYELGPQEQQQQKMLYPEGEPSLESGQVYYLIVEYAMLQEDGKWVAKKKRIPLEVMRENDRQQIQTELREQGLVLPEEPTPALKPEDAISRDAAVDPNQEELTYQRAEYFAEQKFFMDAIRELFSIQSPSQERQRLMEDLRAIRCNLSTS